MEDTASNPQNLLGKTIITYKQLNTLQFTKYSIMNVLIR